MLKTLRRALIAGAAVIALAGALAPADAKPFRWANDGDANSMDPYARNETFLLSFTLNIYEPLIRRDPQLRMEPALATEWTQASPTVWRFKLRPNVKFHDGTPFSADDVVFSYTRATTGGSNIKSYFASVKGIRKIDDLTVEFDTDGPNPILPEEITNWAIMSKAWAEKNNATVAADLTKREESYATRNANGTGPFMLKSREPDVKTVLVPNPNWWDKATHDITEATFFRIGNDATRIAALLSGEVDFVYTVPPQDMERIARTPGLKNMQGPELRTIYLGFDQLRPELQESSVKGKNPFKDRRVRQAFYQAIDMQAISTRVMRGQSSVTALMLGAGVNGFTEAQNKRAPHDVEAAKRLLAEAGYPTGFEVGMDCPNDRYVNDEQICQAVAAMLARIGIKVNLNAQTRAKYFEKINTPRFDTSFYLLGWTPATYDAHNVFLNLIHCRDLQRGRGMFNNGGYCNPEIDKLTDAMAAEVDRAKRQAIIEKANKLLQDDFGYIPLHQQTIVWSMKTNIEVEQYADNFFPLRLVKIK
ncbi:MAG: ABC transporter substrate-binding protein [Alphaproteobacteria bacterium]|nr:ABC transporter substrate-binding protein [Alphaproteobacteria bacterium]